MTGSVVVVCKIALGVLVKLQHLPYITYTLLCSAAPLKHLSYTAYPPKFELVNIRSSNKKSDSEVMFRNVLLKSQVCQINLKFSLKQNLITETQVLSNFLL